MTAGWEWPGRELTVSQPYNIIQKPTDCIFLILLTAITSQCNILPNGRCSHFCFPTPSYGRVCGCPYGMKLQVNQRDCIKDDSVPPPDTSCGDQAFACDEGHCTPLSQRCDGIADCFDKTDEANCTDTGDFIRKYVWGVAEGNYWENSFINLTTYLVYLHQEQPVLHGLSPATTSTASGPVGAVMAWMTAATALTKQTVPLESLKPVPPTTLPATTTGVSLNHGCVTVWMTAAMALMNTTAVSMSGANFLLSQLI